MDSGSSEWACLLRLGLDRKQGDRLPLPEDEEKWTVVFTRAITDGLDGRRVFTSINGSEALRAKSTPPDGVGRVETRLPQMGVTCPGIRPLWNTI